MINVGANLVFAHDSGDHKDRPYGLKSYGVKVKVKHLVTLTVFTAIMIAFAGCGDYVLKANAEPASVSPGGKGRVIISFEAKGKYHIEPDGLVRISFKPPSGVAVEKTDLTQEDRGENGTFSTGFTVANDAKPGPAEIQSEIIFQLCTEEQCKIITGQRAIPLKIQ